MDTSKAKLPIVCMLVGLLVGAVSCGGGGGGDGSDRSGGSATASSVTIQGTLRSANGNARVLQPGEGGIPGVTVSSLGDSAVTDENGNFNLVTDGNLFAGGPAEFTFSGAGISTAVVLDGVIGGPGAMAFVDFILEDNGDISGESFDAEGNVRGSTPSSSRLGCTETDDFVDGGNGALWKPHSERFGTVVILMPAEYRNAEFALFNSRNEEIPNIIQLRDCCNHNANREHIYLTQSAGSLAASNPPLTARFTFSSGRVDCRTVPDPRQRYD